MLKEIRKPILLFAAMLLAGLVCANSSANAQEDFDSAFESSELPWYDASSGGLKQSNAPQRPESIVSDRNRIPLFQTKKKGQPKPKPAAAAPAAAIAGTASTIGTTVVWVAGAVLAGLIIALLVYGFLKLESGDGADGEEAKKRKRKIRDHIKHLPFELEEQDGDFETFAEKCLQNGDYSNAVIYLFADLLVAMSESGVVRLQRGKTNRQYLNEIWDHGEIRPYYRKVMTAFEDAFFGKHEIEKSRAEECFAERPAFDVSLEKIRQMKFAASQNNPAIPSPSVGMEGV